jgi:hypothetical protein
VSYGYKPLIFDYFMKQAAGATAGSGVYAMNETIYLKPRSQAAMLMQANNTPCPRPIERGRTSPAAWSTGGPRRDAGTIPGCICPKGPFPPMLAGPP